MITRILYTDIWVDDFFFTLSSEEKLLFIYFLTNERVNIIHLYQIHDKRIEADTGINTPIIRKAKVKFEKAGKIYFKDNFVFLKNASRFEKYEGEKNEIAKEKLFARLSKQTIDWYNNINDTPIHTPTMIPSINHKSYTIRKRKKLTENVDPNSVPF